MSHSLNEIEALSKRAARGAGYSWGMAEEAARASRWLASHDLAGPAHLLEVLEQNDGVSHQLLAPVALTGVWCAASGTLCPLAAGVTLNDCADQLGQSLQIEMSNVSYPLLVVPFAAWAAVHINQPVCVMWQDLKIVTDGNSIRLSDPQSQINIVKAAVLTCCAFAGNREGAARHPGNRAGVKPETVAGLSAFAQRTYAPATDASRRLGAGLSDND
ncbi:MAG: DUF3726 domain-containing protein [Sulfitobacter sp.]